MDVDFTEKLIEEVRNRPILYLLNHPDNKNNMKKLQAWREIQRELNEEVTTLKAKWRNLRDSYKKYKQSKTRGSQAAKKLHSWAWADQMSFIDSAVIMDETQDSVAFPNVEEIKIEDETIQAIAHDSRPQETENAPPIYRRRRRINPYPTYRRIQYLQNRKERNRNDEKVDVKCDKIDLLFLGYADSFKKLSMRSQIQTKFDIARILMDAELSDLETVTSDSSIVAGSSNYSVQSTSGTNVYPSVKQENCSDTDEALVTNNANYLIYSKDSNTQMNEQNPLMQ